MAHNPNPRCQRVAVYCDGFNLYHGLHDLAGRRFLWLDLEALAKRLISSGQTIEVIRYFTAPVRDDGPAHARQKVCLRALTAHTCVEVVLGRFQQKTARCFSCNAAWRIYEEKETDVSIAVSLMEDAVNGRSDTAAILSADSDLCPAIQGVRRVRPSLEIIAVFPPRRSSEALRRACDGVLHIDEAKLRASQLPDVVQGPDGRKYHRPTYWN